MDERTDVSAAFALRLSADLLTAITISGLISKSAASALVDDALKAMLESHPEHEPSLREIAAALTAQVQLVSVDFERRIEKEG
jgi:hypothetical protein